MADRLVDCTERHGTASWRGRMTGPRRRHVLVEALMTFGRIAPMAIDHRHGRLVLLHDAIVDMRERGPAYRAVSRRRLLAAIAHSHCAM